MWGKWSHHNKSNCFLCYQDHYLIWTVFAVRWGVYQGTKIMQHNYGTTSWQMHQSKWYTRDKGNFVYFINSHLLLLHFIELAHVLHLSWNSFLGSTVSRAAIRCGKSTCTPWRSTRKRSAELRSILHRTWPVHNWKRLNNIKLQYINFIWVENINLTNNNL